MSHVTFVWGMVMGACAGIGLTHLLVGLWRKRLLNFIFAAAALSVIAVGAMELTMMYSTSVSRFARTLQWVQVPVVILAASLAAFILLYFGTGRTWLALTAVAGRLICAVSGFIFPPNFNFTEITALGHVRFLGENVAVPVGTLSPATHVGEISSLLLLIFVVDASISLWRKGGRQDRVRALVVGGSITLFILLAAGNTALAHRQAVGVPYLVSMPFVAIIIAMNFEFAYEMFLAGQMAETLQISEFARHEKERALEEFEERVTLAAQAARLGIWEMDIVTGNVWVSDAAREIFQFPEEHSRYSVFSQSTHPEDRARRDALVQRAIETNGGYEIEYRALLPDGSLRWIASRARCMKDSKGEFSRLVAVSLDVTERKQAEELLRLAIEATPSGILLVNADGKIILINSHIEQLFGYRRDELVGQPVTILVPQRDATRHGNFMTAFLTAPEQRSMGQECELFGLRKNGTEFSLEIGLNSIETPSGTLALVSVVDITSRKATEAESQRMREEMSRLNRVSVLGEMTAAIAHELNQPLSGIISNAGAGQRFIDGGEATPDTIREILEDIAADGRRAHDVIQNIRATIKKGAHLRKRIDLNSVVKSVTHMVQTDALLNSCVMQLSLAREMPSVEGDPIQIQQVVINLVTNAFDAMRKTPVPMRKVEIITARDSSGGSVLQVRDQGPGLSEETQKRMFEQFFTTKEEGLGMGLAIVRSIVETHGGTISAENISNGGAQFSIHFPGRDPG